MNYVMAVVSGAKELDLNKLKQILQVKKLDLATPDQVKELTSLSIGAIPPFGNLFDIPLYVDKSLQETEVINFSAGLHTHSMKMKCKDYIDAVNPIIEDFAL